METLTMLKVPVGFEKCTVFQGTVWGGWEVLKSIEKKETLK